MSKRSSQYWKENKEKIYEWTRKWRKENPEKIKEYKRKYGLKLKSKILKIFGGRCECCGETIPEFLTVDHIHNDGYEERKKYWSTRGIYRNIIKTYEENPEKTFKKYRMLCFNCNFGREFNGGICPHKK